MWLRSHDWKVLRDWALGMEGKVPAAKARARLQSRDYTWHIVVAHDYHVSAQHITQSQGSGQGDRGLGSELDRCCR